MEKLLKKYWFCFSRLSMAESLAPYRRPLRKFSSLFLAPLRAPLDELLRKWINIEKTNFKMEEWGGDKKFSRKLVVFACDFQTYYNFFALYYPFLHFFFFFYLLFSEKLSIVLLKFPLAPLPVIRPSVQPSPI